MSTKKPKNYINNADLHKLIVAYLDACNKAEAENRQIPVVPNDIALAIMNIAERFSSRSCYASYVFREDMVAEAVKNCIEYIRNVDPKRPNVFNYFTQVIQYAFWRYIKKEKKNLYSKFKLMQHVNAMSETSDMQMHDDGKHHHNDDVKYGEGGQDYVDSFIADYEEKQAIAKAKAKKAKKVSQPNQGESIA